MANVLFKGETLYKYAFSYNEAFYDVSSLSFYELNRFDKILQRSIDESVYQYVITDYSDIVDYYGNWDESNEYFLNIGERVYLKKPLEIDIAEKIERKYNEEMVINALRTARAAIREYKEYDDISLAARMELEYQKKSLINHMEQVKAEIEKLEKDYRNCEESLNTLEMKIVGRQWSDSKKYIKK